MNGGGRASKEERKHERSHVLMLSGTVLWCGTCGAFAESRANRLQRTCVGPPPQQLGSGGVRSQLNRLRAGLHPVTRARLSQTTRPDGTLLKAIGGYARRQKKVEVDQHFVPYVVEAFPSAGKDCGGGRSAAAKAELLRERVKGKEAKAARDRRIMKKKTCKEEADALIASFMQGSMTMDRLGSLDDDECVVFWNSLTSTVKHDRLQLIPEKPARYEWGCRCIKVFAGGSLGGKSIKKRLKVMQSLMTWMGCFAAWGCWSAAKLLSYGVV